MEEELLLWMMEGGCIVVDDWHYLNYLFNKGRNVVTDNVIYGGRDYCRR